MDHAVQRAHQEFADRNPGAACVRGGPAILPGGHTRTVLTHPPFPLTFVSGEGATLTDADGQRTSTSSATTPPACSATAKTGSSRPSPKHCNNNTASAASILPRSASPSSCAIASATRPRALHQLGHGSEPDGDHPALLVTGRSTIMVMRRLPRRRLYFARQRAVERAVPTVVAPYNDLDGTRT